ncbi:DNA-directed RNA polymerase subunit alpha C-terminal domain-containing protein [Desulfitobacterium sp. THU1]|uniref:DNA-directed RNA polymerase subunit alpha C-terminal domain-containing protein n=1 Tax=Desulfitobacterium sp. THU1 TaxID=3138072 RepID=UPI00311F64E2
MRMEVVSPGTKKKRKNITSKKTITPLDKLRKRILREFPKKKFIGDIIINDSEYSLLIDYFKKRCRFIAENNMSSLNDPIFASALVQIGIKYYDGRFWGHIATVLGKERINANLQGLIGEVFIYTLKKHNKLLLENRSERVNNILMHGFVSDYYANEMFDFFFKYYNIDLERDLSRNTTEMMNNLVEIIQRNDNTGRTYLLVKQTANAISTNVRGGKIRIRRYLRLIDRCFWEQIMPVNPVNRISILFNEWQENSPEFKLQMDRYNNNQVNGGKRSFSTPYLKCDFRRTRFKLILPSQLIKYEYDEDVEWKIKWRDQIRTRKVLLSQGVTGLKTEESELFIDNEDIFNEFSFELMSRNGRIRLFKLRKDGIRFFDREGNHINSINHLSKGEVYSFTTIDEIPRSDALIEMERIGDMIRSCFEFQYGDVLRLPDGKAISIGKKLEEGLLQRKSLTKAYASYEEEKLPVFSSPPTLLLKINEKRVNGTVIEINGNRYRLFDRETTVINLEDRSGETGYILRLADYGCEGNGIYTIVVDVPNDNTHRVWKYVLINGIGYEFEEAPYIFKSKATILFNENLKINALDHGMEKNPDENSYNFEITSDHDEVRFQPSDIPNIYLHFEIPVLKWKFDDGSWNIEMPSDLWHSDFPQVIYLKYPEDRIKLSMDELLEDQTNAIEQAVSYQKSKAKGIYECDTTRFKSWLGRDKIMRTVFLETHHTRIEVMRVITRSVVLSQLIKGDYKNGELIGEFDIVGHGQYYVDISLDHPHKIIAEKLPIQNGKVRIKSDLNSGLYKLAIYEDEPDDTGFGISEYYLIGEFKHNIINPYNLEGKHLEIKHLKKGLDSIFQMNLSCTYVIANLKRINNNDLHAYQGTLLINRFGRSAIAYTVNVKIINLDRLHFIELTYFDGYDDVEFLYDRDRKIICKVEEKGLRRAVRYRRYECLYPEEYVYVIDFTNDVPEIPLQPKIQATEQKVINPPARASKEQSNSVAIEEMSFTARTYNVLNRARIHTAGDIQKHSPESLRRVRNLGRRNMEEIIQKMEALGLSLSEPSQVEVATTSQAEVTMTSQAEVASISHAEVASTPQTEVESTYQPNEKDEIFDRRLSEIGLPMLTVNCLKKANVVLIRDVLDIGDKGLGRIQGFNKNMRSELDEKLYKFGITINWGRWN